ncbi:hypothetical protein ES332_A09G056900v1 [Gossypium tomentosum]|uniref:Uncharacterized protein n=1 Tax=Gossypium tomentosum TaxID=34277 RepID=A0A5D2P3W2_GOSTO|nr:hypothetical protein ES332_A09G056900v1 [Gossypium tomentosum]
MARVCQASKLDSQGQGESKLDRGKEKAIE